MAKNESNVRAFGDLDSGVFIAPVGTTMPTDLATLAAGWKELGWLEESGISESIEVDEEKIKAYQGGQVVKVITSSVERSYTAIALEQNPVVAELRNRGEIGTTATGVKKTVIKNQSKPFERAVVVHVVDGDHVKRICMPKASVSVSGETTYAASAITTTEFTIVPLGEFFELETDAG